MQPTHPHWPWSLTGVTAPALTQSTAGGAAPSTLKEVLACLRPLERRPPTRWARNSACVRSEKGLMPRLENKGTGGAAAGEDAASWRSAEGRERCNVARPNARVGVALLGVVLVDHRLRGGKDAVTVGALGTSVRAPKVRRELVERSVGEVPAEGRLHPARGSEASNKDGGAHCRGGVGWGGAGEEEIITAGTAPNEAALVQAHQATLVATLPCSNDAWVSASFAKQRQDTPISRTLFS